MQRARTGARLLMHKIPLILEEGHKRKRWKEEPDPAQPKPVAAFKSYGERHPGVFSESRSPGDKYQRTIWEWLRSLLSHAKAQYKRINLLTLPVGSFLRIS